MNEGHRRRLAMIYNVEELGLKEFEFLPCIVEDTTTTVGKLNLILSNSTQRERTEYEKMQEIEKLRTLLDQYAKENEKKISAVDMRKLIANILGVSSTKIAQLQSIDRNLVPEAKEKFEKGEIPVSVATEMAGLPKKMQRDLANHKEIKLSRVKEIKEDSKKALQRSEEKKNLTEKDLENVTFTFQDVKTTLGYAKKQIIKVNTEDKDAAIRTKVMIEALQKYLKDMTERVDYDGE